MEVKTAKDAEVEERSEIDSQQYGKEDPEKGLEKESAAAEGDRKQTRATFVSGAGEETVKQRDRDGSSDAAELPLRATSFRLPCFKGEVYFNAASSLLGLVLLWGLTAYCMARPEEASAALSKWFDDVIDYFTWFYIVANPFLTFFIVWVAWRYGDIKLGPKDGEPEFSDASYFAMIFSAGVGVGLFFYGVSEPLWHLDDNYYTEAGYRSQNEISQWSIVITMYHWGFAGWSPYLVMTMAAGLATYRFGLPMTVRSTLYPVLGHYAWGWIGDLIDGYSIVMTVAGVCTSLGLGAMQMATGLQRLGWVDPDEEDLQGVYVILIWIITACATASVVSGLEFGIKSLANTAFALGCIILFLCFVMEKTNYLLNLLVQTTGVYLQWNIFQIPFWTDAFGTLEEGEGRAVDGKSAPTWWMGGWTVFYMAWWVAWCCFVGMFIARISKNRTVRQVIVSVFLCPTVYALLWFSIMGGIGLRQQRQALELEQIGNNTFDDPGYFLSEGSDYCYDVPQEDVALNGTTVFTNRLPGITPVCAFDSSDSTQAWFNVMYSFSYPDSNNFGGFGPFLSGFSLFALAIYFITSSDSGSLVVDILASNGRTEHHWIQRVFWAVTEGAVACALLVAGKSDALGALQAGSIVLGLPFNLFLFIMCKSIVQMCNAIEKNQDLDMPHHDILLPEKAWKMPVFGGIFNIFEFIISLGFVHETRKEMGMDLPTAEETTEFLKALFLPFVPLYKIYSSALIDPKHKYKFTNLATTASYATCFLGWIALFSCGLINHGFVAFAWSLFFINGCILTSLRMDFRGRLGIQGNIVGDFISSSFFYPQVLAQMAIELNHGDGISITEEGYHDE